MANYVGCECGAYEFVSTVEVLWCLLRCLGPCVGVSLLGLESGSDV